MLERTLSNPQAIADLDRLSPLGTGTVHLNLAAIHGPSRECPRLEEAGGPEPRVEANGGVRHQRSVVSFLARPVSIRLTSVAHPSNRACWSGVTKSRSAARTRWYSSSLADPSAMCTKRPKSAAVRLPHPSARFAGTDAAARRSWAVNPYRSSRGKSLVTL